MKSKDKLTKPTSAGRVAGKGLSTKWSSYYAAGGRKEKKTSSESQSREVEELKAQVAQLLEIVQEQVQQQLGMTLTAMVPNSWADDVDCGRPTGASPSTQLHGQQLAQRADGAIGVSA